jgi:hypothetical protein
VEASPSAETAQREPEAHRGRAVLGKEGSRWHPESTEEMEVLRVSMYLLSETPQKPLT